MSKDLVFYNNEERLIVLKELENRGALLNEQIEQKQGIELSLEVEEDYKKKRHRIKFRDLIIQKNYFVTPILIYINVFVFLLMALSGIDYFNPSAFDIVEWGGNLRFLVEDGEYWRLLSSLFLHGGILHLLFNMFVLLYIGSMLEKKIGPPMFILVYFASGLIASISSTIVHDINVVSAGASGAIFGLCGTSIILLMCRSVTFSDVSKNNLFISLALFAIYNIYWGFNQTGIDNAAHLGGFLSGILIGILYSISIKKKVEERSIAD